LQTAYHEQYNITEDTQPEILILMERTDFSEGEDVNLVDPVCEHLPNIDGCVSGI